MEKILDFYEKKKKEIRIVSVVLLGVLFLLPFFTTKKVTIDKAYAEKEDVARYLMRYHELPKNFITNYGYKYTDNHNLENDGFIMGGDTHINNGALSVFGVGQATTLKECDVAADGYSIAGNRGSRRLVYTCNSRKVWVFYTDDHYASFTELTGFRLQLARNICWIVFSCYAVFAAAFYVSVAVFRRRAETENAQSQREA